MFLRLSELRLHLLGFWEIHFLFPISPLFLSFCIIHCCFGGGVCSTWVLHKNVDSTTFHFNMIKYVNRQMLLSTTHTANLTGLAFLSTQLFLSMQYRLANP